jgi:hypothetical protein
LIPELLRLFIQKIAVYKKAVKWPKYAKQTVESRYADISYMGSQLEEIEEPQQELLRKFLLGISYAV